MKPPLTAITLLLGQLRPYRAALSLGVLLMGLEMLMTLAMPWMAGRFTGQVMGAQAGAADGLVPLLVLWAGLLLVQFGARAGNGYLLNLTAARVMIDLSRRVHGHLQILPLAFHQQRRSGELLALLSHDVTQLSHFVAGSLAGLLPLVLLLIGAATMILLIDPAFGVVILLLTPVLVVLVKLLTRQVRPLASAAVREQAQSLAVANETLGMLRLVKAHALEAARQRAYQEQTARVLALRRRQLWQQAAITPVVYLVAGLSLLGLLGWAGQRLATGDMTPPELVSISLYGLLLIRPVSGLGALYLQLEQARGAAERLVEVLEEMPEPLDQGGLDLPPLQQGITFRDLAFGYPGRPTLLDRVELEIHRGEAVAITGVNGAGKTTLAHLLMRFVAPQRGAVLFDGQDIAEANLSSLRRQVGYVPQEILIADGSIRDNIAFGRPETDDAAIEAAARAAGAHTFIASLPEGYATQVGDQGTRLSGGQRQRLALARALLGRPQVLVLDEATSQLDLEAEADFIAALRPLLADHTTLIVAHRPAMLALASRVLRLEDGCLFESTAKDDGSLPDSR